MLHEYLFLSAPEVFADSAKTGEPRDDPFPDNFWPMALASNLAATHRFSGPDRAGHL